MKRVFFHLVALLAVGGSVAASAAGCGEECEGGVIVNGVCEGKCTGCLENNVCVGNRCMLLCTSHSECYAPFRGDDRLQGCEPAVSDSATGLNDADEVMVCTDSPVNPKVLTPCFLGSECDDPNNPDDWACPDGTPCTEGSGSSACSAAECRPLVCRSAGEGDTEAFCSTFDCVDDSDCGPGLYCSITRVATQICGTDKGDELPCVDPADFKKDGATFQEGPISALRNVCKKREPCGPCVDNADCSLTSELECVPFEGHVCAKVCDTDDACPNDMFCTQGYCLPRTGTCTPPATDNFCWNCTNDLQCGDASTTVVCGEASAGQRACIDVSFPFTCTSDGDCPESPSGKHGECLDEGDQVLQGDPLYKRCYYPIYDATLSAECWGD